MGKRTNQLRTAFSVLLILVTAISIGCNRSRPAGVATTPTPAATSPIVTLTPSATPSTTATATPSLTATATSIATSSPTPTVMATSGPTPTVMATPPVATPTPAPTAGLKTLTVFDTDLPKPPIDGLTFRFLKPARGDYGPGKIRATFGALSYSVWFSVADGKLGLYHLPKREALPPSLAGFYDSMGVDQYATFAEEGSYWVVIGGRSFKVQADIAPGENIPEEKIPGEKTLYDNFSNLAAGKQVTVSFLTKDGGSYAVSIEGGDLANQGGGQTSTAPPATLRFTGKVEAVTDLWVNGIPPWLNIAKYDPELTGVPSLVSVSTGDGTATVSYVPGK